jgi:Tfp pilus assembly protein PilN
MRRTASGWSALLGIFKEGKLEGLETKKFPLAENGAPDSKSNSSKEEDAPPTPTSELDLWLEKNEVNQVYTLLSAGRTITRVLELNVSEDEDVEQALRLQAESHLLGGAPAYRVGMASLPSRSDQKRQGILFSWPDKGEVDLPETNENIWFIPETAALLALVPAKVQGNLFVHSDRETGSISILLDTPAGLIARSTRIMQNDGSWKKDVVRTVVETAISSNMTTEEVGALKSLAEASIEADSKSNQCLIIPTEAREQVQEWVREPLEDEWMDEWGLSLGALFAQSGRLAPLTRLQSDRQMGNIGPVGELVRTFSQTQTTLAILAATLIAMTLVPLFSAWTSNAIVKGKIDDLESLSTALERHDTQKGIYNEVATRSWPMTKLLGDLANCVPLGIEADTIMINEGDSIILRGRAGRYKGMNPDELLGNMLTQLDDTGVFENATYSNEPINSSGVIDFSLTARVKSPFLYVRNFDHDFGKIPHVQLRYPGAFKDAQSGDSEDGPENDSPDETNSVQTDLMLTAEANDGRSTRPSSTPSAGTRSSLGDSSRNSSRPRSSSNSSSGRGSSLIGSSASAARRSDQTTARGSSGPAVIPESPTNNELAAMSKSEAKSLLTKVAEARQRKDLDEETKDRLKQDFDRIITHMKSARDEGDS